MMGDKDDTKPSMPIFSFHDEHEALAKTAYTTYLAQMAVVGFHTPEGVLPPPPYDELDPRLRECWRKAVMSALRKPPLRERKTHDTYIEECDLTLRIHPPTNLEVIEFDAWRGQLRDDEEGTRTRHTIVFEEL